MNDMKENTLDPKNESHWMTHAEHEARRDNSGNAIPKGWELDPVWGPINGAIRPMNLNTVLMPNDELQVLAG